MIFILTKKCVIENNSFVGYSNSSQRQLTEERRIYLKNYKSTIIRGFWHNGGSQTP